MAEYLFEVRHVGGQQNELAAHLSQSVGTDQRDDKREREKEILRKTFVKTLAVSFRVQIIFL